MSHNSRNATGFIALISAAGLCSVGYGLTQTANWHPQEALALFAIAVVAARMKVKLPGLTGTMSVNLPFVLLAVAELNLGEALLVACASTSGAVLAQSWSETKARTDAVQHQLDGNGGCAWIASFSPGSERPTSLATRRCRASSWNIGLLSIANAARVDRDRAYGWWLGKENLGQHRKAYVPLLRVECGGNVDRDGRAPAPGRGDFTPDLTGHVWHLPVVPDIFPAERTRERA
jgi:hypothetical protein